MDELSESLLGWMKSVKDPLLEGPLSTPYYEKAMADVLNAEQGAPADADEQRR